MITHSLKLLIPSSPSPPDDEVECELTKTSAGWEVKGVWVGEAVPHDPDLLSITLESWCHAHYVPEATKAMLVRSLLYISVFVGKVKN